MNHKLNFGRLLVVKLNEMKKLLLIKVFFLSLFMAQGQVSKTNSTAGTITNVPASGTHIDRTFTFTGADFSGCSSLTEVEISINLLLGNGTPPALGGYGVHEDLNVRLVSPTGTAIDLVQDRWGYWTGNSSQLASYNSFAAVDGTVHFDDDHPTSVVPVGPGANDWITGNFSPHNPLSGFDGEDPVGTWTLRISDGNGQFAASDYVHFVTATLTVTCGLACTDPDVPTVTASAPTICPSGSSTLNITGNLNDATQWNVYTGSCGGTSIGTTSTGTFVVSPTTTTTYFIRGEGGCVTPGTCGSVTVTVQDVTNPTITCPGNQTLNANASCQAILPDYTGLAVASDNCTASPTITQSPVAGTTISGNTVVTLTATDGSGNSSNCNFNVTLNDVTPPTAVCQNITVFLDGSGSASITAGDVDGGSTDNCGLAGLSVSPAVFSCANVGANTVTLTATDNGGNSSSCVATVTVIDTVSPSAVCQNITVYLDGSGNASITAADVDGGSSDNCGLSSLSVSPSSFTCANTGANTVTLTAVDNSGNTSVCNSTVTVIDSISPTAVCQNITVFLDGSGNASITATDVDGGSSDNCGLASLSVSPSSFTCADAGANLVTLTATDVNGNTSTCTATVTVADTTAPTAVCQNLTVYLDGSGSAVITAGDVDAGSTDNCGLAGLSVSPAVFNCSNVGANTVTFTVTDVNGNSATCSSVVTVIDSVTPVASCQNITVYLDGSGNASITAADVDAGSSDNCSLASLSVSPSSFTCANVGANTVTLTATDAGGNTSTCTSTVTVIDSVTPNAVCQNITVFLDGTGNASITASDIDGGSSDNCGIASISASSTNFTCADVGPNSVTLTVIDNAGNTSTCTSVVTVADTTAPTAVCQNVTVYLDGAGAATITASDVDAGSVDNCGVAGLSVSPAGFTCANVGTNTVTLTVTDASGNVATCTSTVTVNDTISPTITCPGNQIESPGAGCVFVIPDYTALASASDNCGTPTITQSPAAGTSISSNTTITMTATDAGGNTSSCTFDVILQDNTAPSITCPANQSLLADATCQAVLPDYTGMATVSDNCDANPVLTQSPAPGTVITADVTVTLTATDASTNSANCSFNVTFVTTSTQAVCQDVTVYVDGAGNASITPADIDGGSTAECGLSLTLTASQTSFTCADVSTGVVPLNDLVITAVYDATLPGGLPKGVELYAINDIPDLSLYGISSANNGGGSPGVEYTFPADAITAGSYIYVASEATEFTNWFGFAPDYTDGAMNINGDDAIELFLNGSVIDVFGDINTDGTGEPWEYLDGWAYRNNNTGPDGSTFQLSSWMFSSPNALDGETSNATAATPIPVATYSIAVAGPTEVTLYAEDGNGTIDSCVANVMVLDTIAPMAMCMDTTVELDNFGNGSINVSMIDAGSSDNCGILSTVVSTTDFTCAEVGNNTVTLTVQDASGNTGTCTANVLVYETVFPTATNAPDTLVMCAGDVPAPDPSVITDAADNCGSVVVTHVDDVYAGTSCPDTLVRTYNVEDASGNSINVTHTFIINDTIAPTASNPVTLQVQCPSDVPTPTVGWVSDEADNCGSTTVAFVSDVSDGLTCPETITRTFSVTDDCGNSINVEQLIIVNDTEDPILDAASLDEVVGFCDLTPATPTASDNCDGTIQGVADVTFPINTPGTTLVTWTFTDACGNSVMQTQDVTVEQINVDTWMASDGITIVSDNLAADSYQWIDCATNQPLTGETNHNFTPTYSSDFAVIVTQDGCSDTSACVTITGVGIDELVKESFTMFPNPTTGVFTIAVDSQLKDVVVLDMLGREVEVTSNLEDKTVDGSNLANGSYIVRITTENGQQLVGTISVRN